MKEEITTIFQQLVYTFGENFQQPFEYIIQFINKSINCLFNEGYFCNINSNGLDS